MATVQTPSTGLTQLDLACPIYVWWIVDWYVSDSIYSKQKRCYSNLFSVGAPKGLWLYKHFGVSSTLAERKWIPLDLPDRIQGNRAVVHFYLMQKRCYPNLFSVGAPKGLWLYKRFGLSSTLAERKWILLDLPDWIQRNQVDRSWDCMQQLFWNRLNNSHDIPQVDECAQTFSSEWRIRNNSVHKLSAVNDEYATTPSVLRFGFAMWNTLSLIFLLVWCDLGHASWL